MRVHFLHEGDQLLDILIDGRLLHIRQTSVLGKYRPLKGCRIQKPFEDEHALMNLNHGVVLLGGKKQVQCQGKAHRLEDECQQEEDVRAVDARRVVPLAHGTHLFNDGGCDAARDAQVTDQSL